MWEPATKLEIDAEDRRLLETWTRAHNAPQSVAMRCQVILLAADGVANNAIAKTLGVSRPTVLLWRARFAASGPQALVEVAPGRGRRRSITAAKVKRIVTATTQTTPRAATHWSCRTLADTQGVSHSTVQRIWDAHGLQPHRTRTFKLSRDKRFVEKLTDVVGLYLHPPDKAIVLCVDEKSQIQALDRTQPGLPLKKGRCGTMTHDYKRHGTTTLFAALNVLEGKVIGQCLPHHTNQEFLRFLRRLDREFSRMRAGQYTLVKASIAGAIVTNTLFMLGASFLLGGLKHHVQEYNRASARLQAGLLFLATIAMLVPSAVSVADSPAGSAFAEKLSVSLSVLLIAAYGLGLLFSLKTHREFFGSAEQAEAGEAPWPLGLALATLAGVTVLVALVSEVFVESVQQAAVAFGMTPAFVGFIVVALVGGAAEMASAFSAARKDRLDLSVGIALGSASQIALFVAPILVLFSYVIGPVPMDLQFWPGAVVMMLIATMTASLVTNSGRSAWFVGVLMLMVYLIFAMTLYLLPPRLQ